MHILGECIQMCGLNCCVRSGYMDFEYQGKTYLRGGFRFPGLYEYMEEAKKKLSQPLRVPMYATAGESDRMAAISEKAKKDPYLNRAVFNQLVQNYDKTFSNVHIVSYNENERLYRICLFVTGQLTEQVPMIFLYSTDTEGYVYNAFALDHQDKVWIYVSSQFFREHGMLQDPELCYLIGHELGHAQCHHSTITNTASGSSDMEYSADRAGLIACAQWLRKQDPELPMEQAAQQAVLYAAACLQKLANASTSERGTVKWTEFDYDSIQDTIRGIFKGASKMTASVGTHPHTRHRIMAMIHFSQSQLFYRCMNEDPRKYEGLLSDQHLQNIMQYQLIG